MITLHSHAHGNVCGHKAQEEPPLEGGIGWGVGGREGVREKALDGRVFHPG